MAHGIRGKGENVPNSSMILRLIVFCIPALWFCVFQGPCPASGAPIDLFGEAGRIDVGPFVSVLRDPGGTMTIGDVLASSAARRFEPNTTSHVHLPGEPDKTWIRLQLRDSTPAAQGKHRWVLEINCSIVDMVELYLPDPDTETGYRPVEGNRSARGTPTTLPFRNYSYHIDAQTSQTATYYLCFGSFGPDTIPLVLRTDDAFNTYAMFDYFYFGLIYGIMLAMVLYNLFIFFSLRNGIYLIYVFYMLSFITYFLLFNGHASAVVQLDGNMLQVLEWVFLGTSIFFSISFCQRFFDTMIHTPRWHRVLVFFKVAALIIALFGLLSWHEAAALVANAAGILGPVNLIIVGILRWRQGFETARYYILANLFFMIGTLIYVLWTLGVIPVNIPSNTLFTLGPAIEAVLLSFALADRIRALEREKLVLARSRALYKKASETDGLTGLYNKDYLMQRLEEEVREAEKTGLPLSLIIMDVDDFKRYNDTYGHPEGDSVLQALADVITGEIRNQDAGFRYGGEEFTVVFPDAEAAQSFQAAERIRQSFAARTFKPGGGITVSATVSIGVAQLVRGENASGLIRRADQALYQAKRQGKNRVVTAL